MAKDDFGFAAPDSSSRAGREVPAPHGHLVAESEDVGGVSTRGENVAAGLALDEVLNGIVAGAQGAKRRMVPGHVIKATSRTAD